MPQTDIGSASASEVRNAVTEFTIDSETTDGPQGLQEFTYQNSNFSKYLGYYKNIPELKIAIDTKANWVLGNGYKADEPTMLVLDAIKGTGKDTFNSILENMERTCYIGEDAYAEIITDEEDQLINLKMLDPSTIKVVHNSKGMVLRYEQTEKVLGESKTIRKFEPHEIFVLSNNRMADEVHGTSVVGSVEFVIKARNEAMQDWQRVLHRNVDPLWVFHLDTDDTSKVAAFKTKMDAARGKGENMYIPKGAVVPELITTASNASLNPQTWINQLNDYFFQAVGVPQIIVGNSKDFTDASAKIVYLAFEQRVKGRQKYVEEQISNQLNVLINLVFPASMQNESVSSRPADDDMETSQGLPPPREEPLQQAKEPIDNQVPQGGGM